MFKLCVLCILLKTANKALLSLEQVDVTALLTANEKLNFLSTALINLFKISVMHNII